jgi:hypothetical protein
MSASPTPFIRIRKPNPAVIQTPVSPFDRVIEPDESIVDAPASDDELRSAVPIVPRVAGMRWPLYLWVLTSLLAGVTVGRLIYLLWERVALHDQQLAWHQAAITGLRETRTAVSDQANRLRALDTNTAALQAVLDAQTRKLADLEKGQTEVRDQLNGMNMYWQKQISQLRRDKAPVVAAAPVAKMQNPLTVRELPVAPAQPASDKHNETFSPDLKPTPNSYAQMSANGLVVWMTPRPGFPKPVSTSVIGYVRGLGMLVHDWDDNKHYFISEAGDWTADQR